ncbi:MAG: DUF3775 domain-containing protein [Rhodospirillales bacterium]
MLEIALEKVCFLILKAHQYDGNPEPDESEPEHEIHPTDDDLVEELEDHAEDPVGDEITAFVDTLNVDEQIDLVALLWLGRDGSSAEDWNRLRTEASRASNEHTATYLMGTPLLGDYLSNGLALLGLSCEDYELLRL